jgi:hypothetical protein
MPFPVNVPDVDGVPPVTFAPGSGGDIILAAADAIGIAAAFDGPMTRWGIYRGGFPVVIAESVLAVDFKREFAISDYPLEGGSFESYNKVRVPHDARVVLSSGGSLEQRRALLSSIESIIDDLELYDVVTPEAVYPSVNLVHMDYRRSAQSGAGLLQVAVWLREVRVTVGKLVSAGSGVAAGSGSTGNPGDGTGDGSSTAAPSGADQINGGTVQGQVPSPTGPVAGSVVTQPIPDTAIPNGPGGGGNVPEGEIALEAIDVPAGQ